MKIYLSLPSSPVPVESRSLAELDIMSQWQGLRKQHNNILSGTDFPTFLLLLRQLITSRFSTMNERVVSVKIDRSLKEQTANNERKFDEPPTAKNVCLTNGNEFRAHPRFFSSDSLTCWWTQKFSLSNTRWTLPLLQIEKMKHLKFFIVDSSYSQLRRHSWKQNAKLSKLRSDRSHLISKWKFKIVQSMFTSNIRDSVDFHHCKRDNLERESRVTYKTAHGSFSIYEISLIIRSQQS